MGLIITTITERPPDIAARRFSEFTRAGMKAAADLWHEKYIRLHFQSFSAAKYGYQRRRRSTAKRKISLAKRGRAAKGGRVDLVMSGLLERQMLRRGILRIYPTRFTLTKPAGSYITNRPRKGRPNMMQEITAITASEDRMMSKACETEAAKLMNNFRATRRTRT